MVESFSGASSILVTTLVAVNVDPMLLAWGSRADLLWLRACRTRGLPISMIRFGLEGRSSYHWPSPPGSRLCGSPRLAGCLPISRPSPLA